MKLAFVISTQPTRFEAVAFSEDLSANLGRLAALGYDGVELAVREPARLDVTAIRRMLDAHHLRVPALGTGQAFVEEHLSFTDPDPGVRERAAARIESHIPLAREFGAIVILGLIRGRPEPEVSPAQAHARLLDALRRIGARAQEQGVRLALEPINRYETLLLNTVHETLELLDELRLDNLGILFDTFHSNIEEPRPEASLQACGARLFHVHLADSNRWAPGTGHIDFRGILSTLREMKYAGWVSAEILPKPDLLSAAEQTARTIRPLLKELF